MYPTSIQQYPQERLAAGLNVLAAIWLIVAPWLLRYTTARAHWNDVVIGIFVGVIALIRFLGAYRAAWLSWINVVLGLWLIVSSWVLADATPQAHWNDTILGILIVVLAAWAALADRRRPAPPGTPMF